MYFLPRMPSAVCVCVAPCVVETISVSCFWFPGGCLDLLLHVNCFSLQDAFSVYTCSRVKALHPFEDLLGKG